MGLQFYEVATYAVATGVICLAVFRGLKRASFGAVWTFDIPFSELDFRHIILGLCHLALPPQGLYVSCQPGHKTALSPLSGKMVVHICGSVSTVLSSAHPAGLVTDAYTWCFTGMVMGCLAAGIALCFMQMHFAFKRLWLRLGLHVRPIHLDRAGRLHA